MSKKTGKVPERPLLGAHISTAGGCWKAVERAVQIRANVAQLFVKNNNQWNARMLTEDEAHRFRQARLDSGIGQIAAHAGYLINLASPDRTIWKKSISAMVDELGRCFRLGVNPLVVHPGAHRGRGSAWGIRRIATALDRILCEAGTEVTIALEHVAGQGTGIGFLFEHLRDILGRAGQSGALRVCLDTCHLFAAGYDISDLKGYRNTMEAFDRAVGMDRLAVLHLNDSKRSLGSRVDRHHHIGRGEIGLQAFFEIMNDPRLSDVPKILETPKGKGSYWDRRNLGVLRRLAIRRK